MQAASPATYTSMRSASCTGWVAAPSHSWEISIQAARPAKEPSVIHSTSRSRTGSATSRAMPAAHSRAVALHPQAGGKKPPFPAASIPTDRSTSAATAHRAGFRRTLSVGTSVPAGGVSERTDMVGDEPVALGHQGAQLRECAMQRDLHGIDLHVEHLGDLGCLEIGAVAKREQL